MFGSIQFLVSYGSVRIVLYVVLTLLFALFYARVLMKRGAILRALGIAALAIFVLVTAAFPVENALVRFETPEDAVRYSLPNQQVQQVLEHGDWATALCKDRRTVALQRDAGGWKAVNPAVVGWGVRSGSIENVSYQIRRIADGVWFVGVSCRKYADESGNEGKLLIDTITDVNGSKFGLFQTEILGKDDALVATDNYYYAFVDSLGDGYHLLINGEARPFD